MFYFWFPLLWLCCFFCLLLTNCSSANNFLLFTPLAGDGICKTLVRLYVLKNCFWVLILYHCKHQLFVHSCFLKDQKVYIFCFCSDTRINKMLLFFTQRTFFSHFETHGIDDGRLTVSFSQKFILQKFLRLARLAECECVYELQVACLRNLLNHVR